MSRPPTPVAALPERPVFARLADGRLLAVSMPEPGSEVRARTSVDRGVTWGEPVSLLRLPPEPGGWAGLELLADRDGELHLFLLNDAGTGVIRTGEGQHLESPASRRLDIWHARSTGGGRSWPLPRCIWQGYTGALNSVVQLSTGRILLPFSCRTDRSWARRGQGPEAFTFTGTYESTVLYSDDEGGTWRPSPTPLRVPVPDITYAYGAVEPVVLELAGGRVWMLIRTQMGRFYEAFSSDGASWSEARPTAITSSDSPAGLVRLDDGRIVLLWNNCLRHPYAYGGRQVLHAAVSADEGRTWRGYREVARDPRCDEPPPSDGDHGTAYPFPCALDGGQVLFTTGQGQGRVLTLRLDADWLTEDTQRCDFAGGLEGWSTFGTRGCETVPHPTRRGGRVLWVRRPEAAWPAAAVWCLPLARRGRLRLRLLLRSGSDGLVLGLTDHFSPPFDPEDGLHNLYALAVGPGGLALEPEVWHAVRLAWDGDGRRCRVDVDGRRAAVLAAARSSPGVCYLRLRAAADGIDPAGALIDRVEVRAT